MTKDTFSDLDRNGYCVFENFATKDRLAQFEKEVAIVSSSCAKRLGVDDTGDNGLIAAFRAGGPFRDVLYRMIQNLPALRAITNDVVETDGVQQALREQGFELPGVSHSMRVDIPNEAAFQLPPHQDYAGMRSHRALRVWLALRQADEHYGTMAVFPGSHRNGALPHNTENRAYPKIEAEDLAGSEEKIVHADAGTGILFDMLLVHRSVPNISDAIKFTLTITMQDLAVLADPSDENDSIGKYFHLHAARADARKNA